MGPLFTTLLDIVYPRYCVSCGRDVDMSRGHTCWDCRSSYTILTHPFCSRCGDPVDGKVLGEYLCSWCRRHGASFESARSAARYRGALRSAIHALKYERASHVAADLVPLLGACVRTHFGGAHFDAVTCVPLHARKERERTYNQSALLAAGLASELRLPLAQRCLARPKPTETQTDLSASQRRANVRGAFRAVDRAWVEGRSLLLVDDVMTTGATVQECSRVLKSAGAAGVYVVTVARG